MAFSFRASILSCVLLLLVVHSYAQQSAPGGPLSQTCLGCICEAASGCNVTLGCDGAVCGPLRITWGYWADAGKPTVNDEPSTNEGAYPRCVNDLYCASRAVQGYMTKFGQDCNRDGKVDCDDFVRIHRLGGYGCGGQLEPKYENTYRLCMQTFG